jgi:hypothetical protein
MVPSSGVASGRVLTYSMLRAGVLQSILLTYPGCIKGLRLIDGDSSDRLK